MKIHEKQDIIFALLAVIIFCLAVFLVPIYDAENGLHNLLFDSYNITWSDNRSPINFYVIKNLINDKGVFFPPDFVFWNVQAKDNYDLYEYRSGQYVPGFNLRPVFIYSVVLTPFHFASDLELYKAILFVNIILYSAILLVFYFLQRVLGLTKKFAFLSSATAALATSIFIYVHYLFLTEIITTLFFMLFIFFLLKYWKKDQKIGSLLIPSFFALFIFFLNSLSGVFFVLLFITIYFAYWRKKSLDSLKIFLAIAFLAFVGSYLFSIYFEFETPATLANVEFGSISSFKIFNNYISADDFNLYGYHDLNLQNRTYSFIYGFSQKPGDAIFIHAVGIFGTLFGEKGFVYNSVFLIFSIIGIFYYKDKPNRNLILAFAISLVILLSLRTSWYGGVTPRYIRSFDIPILLLTFFTFNFIQENKNKVITLLFVLLVVVSFLNVMSLTVRTDWAYEQHNQLVSYDLLLWPFPSVSNFPKPLT